MMPAGAKVRGAYRRAGWKISSMGSRIGVDALTYNPVVFEFFHSAAVADAPAVVTTLREVFPHAQRLVDVGAGTGAFAAEAKRAGLAVSACEHARPGRRWARRQGVESRPFDLTAMPPAELAGPFDLAYCFEVAEHVPPDLGDRLVDFLAGLAPTVVFTAAQPGQGGIGHINEQPASYWQERFERAGKQYDTTLTTKVSEGFSKAPSAWLGDNVLVFRDPAAGA
jgi:SAM-dependent methyltransferase